LNLPWIRAQDFLAPSDVMGYLTITVLNELRANESVASSVDVLMFFGGGPDIMFGGASYTPSAKVPLMIGNSALDTDSVIRDGVIGDETAGTVSIEPVERVMGESVRSIKQILNRNQPFWFSSIPSNSADWALAPWFFSATTTSAGSITAAGPGGDLVSAMGLMYAFYRGSMRVSIIPATQTTYAVSLTHGQAANWMADAASGTFAYSRAWQNGTNTSGAGGTLWTDEKVGQYRVPFHNHTKVMLVEFNTGTSYAIRDGSCPSVALLVNGANHNTMFFGRSLGEDARFSGFVGVPPLFVSIT
jgi:hypothetical protein